MGEVGEWLVRGCLGNDFLGANSRCPRGTGWRGPREHGVGLPRESLRGAIGLPLLWRSGKVLPVKSNLYRPTIMRAKSVGWK